MSAISSPICRRFSASCSSPGSSCSRTHSNSSSNSPASTLMARATSLDPRARAGRRSAPPAFTHRLPPAPASGVIIIDVSCTVSSRRISCSADIYKVPEPFARRLQQLYQSASPPRRAATASRRRRPGSKAPARMRSPRRRPAAPRRRQSVRASRYRLRRRSSMTLSIVHVLHVQEDRGGRRHPRPGEQHRSCSHRRHRRSVALHVVHHDLGGRSPSAGNS